MDTPPVGGLVARLLVLSAAFGLVQRWRPARPRRGWPRPGLGTDIV